MKKKTQWVSLLRLQNCSNETLTASSATTNLPTSPSIATAHALSQRHHQHPSHRACQQALSANIELPKAHARASQHPRVFKPRPTEWKPKRAAKRERFQKRILGTGDRLCHYLNNTITFFRVFITNFNTALP